MPATFMPPPVGGWNTFDNIAGMGSEFAPVLDNFLPEAGRLRMRAGWRSWATGLPGRVDGLMFYRTAGASALFAASGGNIYDVTAAGAVGAAVVSGQTSSRWDGLNVAAAGGSFLLAFNGQDPAQLWSGTSWVAWSATVVPAAISWAMLFKGQLYAGRGDYLGFYYGGAGAITGAFTAFPLQSVAKRGGAVIAAADWTLDSGQGPDDYAAFLTSEGELIVYQGTNPSSPATWSLKGVFSLPRPINSRCLRPFGGDVLAMTEGGIFPLGALVSGTDEAALAASAYTQRIEPTWLDLTRGRRVQSGWDLVGLPSYGVWLANIPWGSAAQQVAFRAATGACARWVGIPAACWIEASGRAFFGHASAGMVCLWGEDESDNGAAISAECVTAFATFGRNGALKRMTMVQPVLTDAAGAVVRATVCIDWQVPTPEAEQRGAGGAAVAVNPLNLVWDVGNWDEKNWAGDGEISRTWRGVSGLGQSAAVRLRLDSVTGRPGWVSSGVLWETGGPLR